ncbi:hypothetical protein KZO01_06710 [Kurthia zopfii]|uniref:ABC-type proline/glycine betaine transport system substrate-binding protein n=1 Tax=Kurthia zopfii TaxID=1650 RepID=A0A8B4Q960_9BACL|nr:glycine betaine ABC transporter substrate-binding protein [Kurthia zopfii]TDR39800.1 ABC-type proline/glycine betaine transport system substrate-binding protein [Kurthia zopfii]GEK30362.1 hypothetical protein KZO01_06710 [Kurthia zopfii]STX09249.1 Glycine betaine-binding protein precursor [Kurthia zopfii]VEI06182.1 Glycine betaine-binding protein precursor [Kurthia zopfii]
MKFSKTMKASGLALALGLSATLAGCGSSDKSAEKDKKIELAYVEWDTEVASTNVIAQVLKDEGFKVKTTSLDNAVMWEAVANDKADAMVAGWLPNTHGTQLAKYKDKVVDLGENLKGAKIGLAVPEYMDVNSIEDLKDQAKKEITGIEPGAGIMSATEKALKDYPNLKDWKLKTASSGAMTVALGQAIKKKEDIVITGWSPHWMFQKYDLKYLEDPKGDFGGDEMIHTFASKELKKKSPEAYKILDKFNWTKEDMEKVMLDVNNGASPEDAAKTWIKDNKDKVAEWTK